MQEFKKGDHVKIAENYSSGSMWEKGEWKPTLNDRAGKEGIVIASYSDQFGTPGTGGAYTIYIKGQGEVSWFPSSVLTLIEVDRLDKLKEWENTAEAERKEKSELDWIFEHGKEVILHPHGASIAALGECFGLTNIWGSGEGFIYYENAMLILNFATPFLEKGDKTGWLARCDEALRLRWEALKRRWE